MAEHDDVLSFTITGETSHVNYLRILANLGALGVKHRAETELLASPSVAIDLVESYGLPSVPALTEDSIAEFLRTQGMAEGAAKRSSRHLETCLVWHFRNNHHKDGCSCPLDLAWTISPLWQRLDIAGIEPMSFVEFAGLPDEEIMGLMKSKHKLFEFGPRRLELVKSLRARIVQDLQIDAQSA